MPVRVHIPPISQDPNSHGNSQSPPPSYVNPFPGTKWVKNWVQSDEFFTTDNEWHNRSRWHVLNPNGWKGRFPSKFLSRNVTISENRLQLTATDETEAQICEHDTNTNEDPRRWGTAFVATKSESVYGYFEIVCRLMDSTASSAFWLARNHDFEIDVFEFSTSKKKTAHGVPFSNMLSLNTHIFTKEGDESNPLQVDFGRDLTKEILKVGLLWRKDWIVWYVNDKEIRREKNHAFHTSLRVQLDSEVMQNWMGLPQQDEQFPKTFEVFYLRSWKMTPI